MRGSSGNYYSLPVRWISDRLPAEGQWTDIHPLLDAMPFWQRDAATLPYFMRAAPLSAEGRWAELIELTERWSAADPRDAEPLRFRGEAMQKLDRPAAAVGALHRGRGARAPMSRPRGTAWRSPTRPSGMPRRRSARDRGLPTWIPTLRLSCTTRSARLRALPVMACAHPCVGASSPLVAVAALSLAIAGAGGRSQRVLGCREAAVR